MKPTELAEALRRIASRIDASTSPSKPLVLRDLKRVIVAIDQDDPTEEPEAKTGLMSDVTIETGQGPDDTGQSDARVNLYFTFNNRKYWCTYTFEAGGGDRYNIPGDHNMVVNECEPVGGGKSPGDTTERVECESVALPLFKKGILQELAKKTIEGRGKKIEKVIKKSEIKLQ